MIIKGATDSIQNGWRYLARNFGVSEIWNWQRGRWSHNICPCGYINMKMFCNIRVQWIVKYTPTVNVQCMKSIYPTWSQTACPLHADNCVMDYKNKNISLPGALVQINCHGSFTFAKFIASVVAVNITSHEMRSVLLASTLTKSDNIVV